MARYLIHASDYGTLATRSRHLSGAPFANLVSLSDGAVGNSTGRLLFYLTPMDSSAYDLQVRLQPGEALGWDGNTVLGPPLQPYTGTMQEDSRASFAAGEAQLPGGCGSVDPEVHGPTCNAPALMTSVPVHGGNESCLSHVCLDNPAYGICAGSYLREGQHHGPHAARPRRRIAARGAHAVQSAPRNGQLASRPRFHSVRYFASAAQRRLLMLG